MVIVDQCLFCFRGEVSIFFYAFMCSIHASGEEAVSSRAVSVGHGFVHTLSGMRGLKGDFFLAVAVVATT